MKSWDRDERIQSLVFDRLAESVIDLSEEEAIEESELAGEATLEKAESTRRLLLETVKAFRLRPLQAAMSEYLTKSEALKLRRYPLPASPGSRRALLAHLFREFPDRGSASLTIQHREFKKLSDADVESLLKQLQELGAWDGTLPKKS